MDERKRVWVASAAGFLVIILLAAFDVNVLGIIPVFGPFFGGIAAGLVTGRDYVKGATAGVVAGFFGLIAVSVDLFLDTGYLKSAIPYSPELLGVYFFLFAMVVYFPILGFIGGAIGGAIRRGMGGSRAGG